MKKARKYHTLTLAAGIAIACLIVFSQLFYFQAATYCQKKAETQQLKEKESLPKQTGEETGHVACISIPSNTIASVSHIQISDGLSFVLQTLLEPEKEQTIIEAPPLTNRLFHTLFRFIIASNAP